MNDRFKFTPDESRQVRAAMGFAEEEAPRKKLPQDSACEAYAEAKGALRSAERAARRGDLTNARQWTAFAERLTAAAERLAQMPEPVPSWEEADAMRAELMDRLTKFAGDDRALQQWRIRLEIWQSMADEAQRTGAPMPAPMPPRPPHWADKLPEEVRRRIQNEDA